MKAIAERAAAGAAFLNERMTLRVLTRASGALFAALIVLVFFDPTPLVIVAVVVVAAAGLLTGTVVYFTDKDGEQDSPPASADMGPDAGLSSLSPVTTATCPGAVSPPKVDRPAPDDVPGRDEGRARDWDAPLPEAGREHDIAPSAATPGPESEPEPPSVTAPVPAAPARRGRHAAPKPSVWDRLPRPVIGRALRPVPPVPAVTADTLPAVLRREEATS